MRDKLINYIESIFEEYDSSSEVWDTKQEIISNSLEKYDDLVKSGKDEEAAFGITVSELGNPAELTRGLNKKNEFTQKAAEEEKRRHAFLVSVSIALYILCVVPVILLSYAPKYEIIGVVLMFIMIAVATGIIIYSSKTKKPDVQYSVPKKEDEINKDPLFQAVSSVFWVIVVVVYLAISFSCGQWQLTWLIFPIAAAVSNIIKAVFEIRKGGK